MRTSHLLWLALLVCLLVTAPPARAGEIAETWRSPAGMFQPRAVSVDPADNSVWVADYYDSSLTHLTADGAALLQKDVPGAIGVSVNVADRSVWVTSWNDSAVLHLASGGAELWRGTDFPMFMTVSADSVDGSCWVGGVTKLVHLSESGAELGRWEGTEGYMPYPSVDTRDGSCWAGVTETGTLFHLASDGTMLWQMDGPLHAGYVSTNSTDWSCWVAMVWLGGADWVSRVMHLAADGSEIWHHDHWWTPDGGPWVAVNQRDGSCWVVTNVAGPPYYAGVTLVAADGTVRAEHEVSDGRIAELASDPADGSLWLALEEAGLLLHLQAYPDCSPFWDANCEQWAVDEITACAEAGIVAGFPDGNYWPSSTVTRDQMAVYISRALAGGDEQVPAAPATASFADVPLEHWASKYVEYVKDQQVVTGYPDGTYQPTGTLDRGQMAAFIARAIADPVGEAGLDSYTPPTTASFPDVPANHWAAKYVEYIKSKSVAGGYPDGTYQPDNPMTRDQMAVYVARAFQLQ